jgi:uncharacterized membrane protein YozB (DUF420 family)
LKVQTDNADDCLHWESIALNRDAGSPALVAYAVSFSTIFGHNVMKKMILPLITQLNAVDSLGIFVLQGLFGKRADRFHRRMKATAFILAVRFFGMRLSGSETETSVRGSSMQE